MEIACNRGKKCMTLRDEDRRPDGLTIDVGDNLSIKATDLDLRRIQNFEFRDCAIRWLIQYVGWLKSDESSVATESAT